MAQAIKEGNMALTPAQRLRRAFLLANRADRLTADGIDKTRQAQKCLLMSAYYSAQSDGFIYGASRLDVYDPQVMALLERASLTHFASEALLSRYAELRREGLALLSSADHSWLEASALLDTPEVL